MGINQTHTDPVKLLFTGDFCPINRIEHLAVQKNFEAIFNDFIGVLEVNDLNITDLECPLTLSDTARPKIGPHQKAHPDTVQALKYVGFRLVALANNHIMDYDSVGSEETVSLLRQHNIDTIGINRTGEEASKYYTLFSKGKKVAIMNFADNEFLTSTDGKWRCNAIDPIELFCNIQAARQDHDFIIVIIHGGNEFYELPSPKTKRLYRYIIDIGADSVISHHTHAFSGYEIYKTKPIFYGLGNFVYDWPGKRNEAWNRGYAVRLSLSDKVDYEIIPLKQGNDQPGVFLLNENEQKHFRKEIERLNRIIEDDAQLERKFAKFCNSLYPVYDSYIEPSFGRHITWLRKRKLFPKLMSRRKRLLLLNIIRAESHRDVLIRMLTDYQK